MSGLKGVEISDVLGLSDPLSKLIESGSRGIGRLYEPIHIKRIAKSKTEELNIISGAINENINIPIIYKSGEIEIDSSSSKELFKRIENRIMFQEMQKQENIESVIGHAYSELEEEDNVSEEEVETDWMLRFMNSVEDISNKEMQELWGKILAGEVKEPKTYSLRTLDVLRNISINEAKLFEKLAKYMVIIDKGIYIYNNSEINDIYDIKFQEILLLEECGLIKSTVLTLKTKVNKDRSSLIYNSKVLGIIKGKKDQYEELELNIYTLSESGNELFRTLNIDGNYRYAIDIIKFIKESLSVDDYSISAHKINNIGLKGVIDYNKENILLIKINSKYD